MLNTINLFLMNSSPLHIIPYFLTAFASSAFQLLFFPSFSKIALLFHSHKAKFEKIGYRKMSTEEKRKLGAALTRLSPEDLSKALEIVAQNNPSFQATAEEVDLDMDAQVRSLHI